MPYSAAMATQRPRREWAHQGECVKPQSVNLFMNYLEDNRSSSKDEHFETFRRLCNGCPVKEECLKYAIVHEAAGFWGGTTAKERRKLRNQKLESLALEALREGWLEDHHLLPLELAQELAMLAQPVIEGFALPPSPQELQAADAVIADFVLEFDFAEPDQGLPEMFEPNAPLN